MFDSHVLTRRLRLRRLRRSTVRSARNFDPAGGIPDLDDTLDDLCIWATGIPWVIESACGARERLMLFVLDCPPLSRHEPWFAISAIDDSIDDGPGIVVILPDAVADRATVIGGRVGIEPIGKRRSITAIALPASEKEFQALQKLLEVTYAAAFGPSN
jgi:hypothetical protein